MSGSADALCGSCLCSGVGFELTTPALSMGNCHCSMCRRQHGTAFSTYVQAAVEGLRVTRGAGLIHTYASSGGAERRFCGTCGSKLFYLAHALPQFVWIAAGAFDDDPGVRPGYHIFVGSKAPWYEITDALPQHAAFPDEAGH